MAKVRELASGASMFCRQMQGAFSPKLGMHVGNAAAPLLPL